MWARYLCLDPQCRQGRSIPHERPSRFITHKSGRKFKGVFKADAATITWRVGYCKPCEILKVPAHFLDFSRTLALLFWSVLHTQSKSFCQVVPLALACHMFEGTGIWFARQRQVWPAWKRPWLEMTTSAFWSCDGTRRMTPGGVFVQLVVNNGIFTRISNTYGPMVQDFWTSSIEPSACRIHNHQRSKPFFCWLETYSAFILR